MCSCLRPAARILESGHQSGLELATDANGVMIRSCVMGASKIFGLSQEEMVQAINLATAPNISLGQPRVGEVSMWKGAAMANAARNAVFAALLAREDMIGSSPIFEGRLGFFRSITGPFQLSEI